MYLKNVVYRLRSLYIYIRKIWDAEALKIREQGFLNFLYFWNCIQVSVCVALFIKKLFDVGRGHY